ncbi:hypothetical protein GCM10009623_22250 [Nocardioides aestuarii]
MRAIGSGLDDVAGVDPIYMTTPEKREALAAMVEAAARLDELRLRVMAGADDLALDAAARDIAALHAHESRLDGAATRRDLRLAQSLDARWRGVAAAFRTGAVNRDQAEVIVHALDRLPDDLDPEVYRHAEQRLVDEARTWGPRQLRIMGRRILHLVAPDVADDEERKALEREEQNALRRTFLTTRRNGDGTTDLKVRVSDAAAHRLLTYLQAFTSPRQHDTTDRRPYDQKLGQAFMAFLECADPARLPIHGGSATTIIVSMPLEELRDGVGVGLVGDEPISAGEVRRLACQASIVPLVLGGDSEILDLGRHRRLFSPAQRKAMAVRDVHCRAEGCTIPAAWCEAHHDADPWSRGGKTDLDDGVLFCTWHHHRAHDDRYDARRLPDGSVRFARRT